MNTPKPSFLALIPFLVFIGIFLGSGWYLGDFYQLPAPVAVIGGIIAAFLLFKAPVSAKVRHVIAGCGEEKVMTMCLIYLLAGAFAGVTKAMGGVEVIVQWGISVIPMTCMAAGIFVMACFLSLAIGTSVGCMVALGPIVVSLAEQSGLSMGLLGASLLTGAMFGDNLSVISDTSIAATQTLGCTMKEKLKTNSILALPAAVLTLGVLMFWNQNTASAVQAPELSQTPMNYWLLLPYFLIIILAGVGVQVLVALVWGIAAAGCIAYGAAPHFSLLVWVKKLYQGFTAMTDIFLLSMLTGGLGKMVEAQGGLQWLLTQVTKKVRSAAQAQWGIAGLVTLINASVANNTVAILISGNLSKSMAQRFKLAPARVATLLDIFACVVQGMLPYGAQVLLFLGFAKGTIGYFDLLPYLYYLFILAVLTIIYLCRSSFLKYPLPDKQG